MKNTFSKEIALEVRAIKQRISIKKNWRCVTRWISGLIVAWIIIILAIVIPSELHKIPFAAIIHVWLSVVMIIECWYLITIQSLHTRIDNLIEGPS